MLYAVLICTDESCAEEFEAWGELEDFEDMLCEGCGCMLHALAFSEVSLSTIVAFPAAPPTCSCETPPDAAPPGERPKLG